MDGAGEVAPGRLGHGSPRAGLPRDSRRDGEGLSWRTRDVKLGRRESPNALRQTRTSVGHHSTARGVSPPRRGPRGQVPHGHRRRRDGAADPPQRRHVPFGVELVGGTPNGGAGFSVSNLGDVNLDGFDDFFIGGADGHEYRRQVGLISGVNSSAMLVFGSRSGRRRQRRLARAQRAATRRRPGAAGQLGEHASRTHSTASPGSPTTASSSPPARTRIRSWGRRSRAWGSSTVPRPSWSVPRAPAMRPMPRTGRAGPISSTAGPT